MLKLLSLLFRRRLILRFKSNLSHVCSNIIDTCLFYYFRIKIRSLFCCFHNFICVMFISCFDNRRTINFLFQLESAKNNNTKGIPYGRGTYIYTVSREFITDYINSSMLTPLRIYHPIQKFWFFYSALLICE